jgi:hypothetical protein
VQRKIKRRRRKDAAKGEPPPPPPEPEAPPEPEPEPELITKPEPTKDDNECRNLGFSSIWGGGKKKKRGEVVEEPLTKTTSKGSGKSAKDVVKDLISLDYYPPAERKKEKKESKIISMLSTFGGGTVKPTSKKETPTEKRVRERCERKEREE